MSKDRTYRHRAAGDGDARLDPEMRALLEHLDPASRDPHYWLRFREWILRRAAPELARRRAGIHVTVSDIVNSWARMLVPAAVAAAAVAAAVVLRAPTPSVPRPVDVEEMLVSDVEGATIPTALGESGDAGAPVTFVMEIF